MGINIDKIILLRNAIYFMYYSFYFTSPITLFCMMGICPDGYLSWGVYVLGVFGMGGISPGVFVQGVIVQGVSVLESYMT